jgi:hypothetical protein
MAKFITSIELQDANETDYIKLTGELEKASFKGEKYAGKSEAYVSGKNVYRMSGNITLQEINSAISKAASKTGKKYSFFVVKDKQTYNVNQ